MAQFRFRAAVVLDLRQQEETAALGARALAEGRFREAYATLGAEQARREAARTDLMALERRGSDLDTLLWHRNWIVRLTTNLDRLRRDLEDRAREVRQADDVWREARRRRLALERMKERAWQRFQTAELQQEMKAMDELARIRYVMPETWRNEP